MRVIQELDMHRSKLLGAIPTLISHKNRFRSAGFCASFSQEKPLAP